MSVPVGPSSERRRMLNVLAQRRYRKRRRDQLQALQAALHHAPAQRETLSRNDNSPFGCFPTRRSSDYHEHPQQPRLKAADVSDISQGNARQDAPDGLHPTMVSQQNPENTAFPVDAEVADLDTSQFSFTDGNIGQGRPDGSNNALISNQSTADMASWLGAELADLEVSHFQFPDDNVLAVPELDVINTACAFAKLLQCESTIWDPYALRTLDWEDSVISTLPLTLRPTTAQRQIAHQPMLDILPWPEVRSKLVCIFAQPPQLRPPKARDPEAILHLVYDMDDSAEGVKVTGADRTNLENWEIGQQVFQNWWWAFDHNVVATSNRLRASRGAARLQISPI